MVNSNRKGKRGELEFSKFLQLHGYEARRGQQFRGGDDSPDVVHNVPGIHFEVKRVQALHIRPAMEQAEQDCGGLIPVVAYKRNRGEWVAILPLHDLLKLIAKK